MGGISLLSPTLFDVTLVSIGASVPEGSEKRVQRAFADAIAAVANEDPRFAPKTRNFLRRRREERKFRKQIGPLMSFLPVSDQQNQPEPPSEEAKPPEEQHLPVPFNLPLDLLHYEPRLLWRDRLRVGLECAAPQFEVTMGMYNGKADQWAYRVLDEFERMLWRSDEGIQFLRRVDDNDLRTASVNALQDLSVSIRASVYVLVTLIASAGTLVGLDLDSVIHFH
jgi:hypothetical protein